MPMVSAGDAFVTKHFQHIAVRTIPRTMKIVVWAALVHCLLTFTVSPVGWELLYSWDSPQWLRGVWACAFCLPFLIVFEHGWLPGWAVTFMLTPVNSLILSWLVIKPIHSFMEFRQTRQKRYLAWAVTGFGFCLSLLGGIAVVWVPSNTVSAREAYFHNVQQFEQWKTNSTNRPRP
jgi:hypothetical protein